jgi:hypothetical protein
MSELATRRAKVAEAVQATGMNGVSITTLMRQFNRSNTVIGGDLRALAAAGLIESTHPNGGASTRWGPIGIREAWRAHIEAAAQQRANRTPQPRDTGLPIRQTRVDVASVPRLRVCAPTSVFSLAMFS